MVRDPLRERIKEYSEITNLGPIIRRYFIIGAFDGALTVLGIVLGSMVAGAGEEHKYLTIALSISAAVALAVSSLVGAYEAERFERKVNQMSMERAMLTELSEKHKNAFRFATWAGAGVHGVAPLFAGLIPVIPFLVLPFWDAAWVSLITTFGVLFAIGAYLGGLAKERVIFSGLRFVAAGLATAIIVWLMGARA